MTLINGRVIIDALMEDQVPKNFKKCTGGDGSLAWGDPLLDGRAKVSRFWTVLGGLFLSTICTLYIRPLCTKGLRFIYTRTGVLYTPGFPCRSFPVGVSGLLPDAFKSTMEARNRQGKSPRFPPVSLPKKRGEGREGEG